MAVYVDMKTYGALSMNPIRRDRLKHVVWVYSGCHLIIRKTTKGISSKHTQSLMCASVRSTLLV